MAEFLNNIWIALNTPNHWIIDILSIPLAFLESALILYFISTILNLKNTNKTKFLYIISSTSISLLSLFFLNRPFNIFFNYVSMFVIIYLILKIGFLKSLLSTVFPTILFTIIQSLLSNPYITLLGINSESLLTVAIYRFPLLLIAYAIMFLLTFVIRHRNWYLVLLDDIDKKSKSIIIFNLLIGLSYIIVEIMVTLQYLDILPLTYTFANFIMLSLYFSISIFSISKIIKLTTTTIKLENAEEYNKTLRILHDNVRGFKHDFDNIVTTIGGYINTDDMEGLKKYYIQLQHDCEKVNDLYILNPSSINNPRYL